MTVTEIKSFDQFKTIINGSEPAVIDFWATWCGPCKVISPIFEKLSDTAEFTHIKFFKVDVDDQQEIAQEVGIRAMPTFALFQNGAKLKELVGANPQGLQQLLKEVAGAMVGAA